jgi:hypothetical protein
MYRPGHFVTTWSVEYDTTIAYDDLARGVPAGTYPAFNNLPDERYPFFEINPSAGAFELLFASDYADNGTRHLLGFTQRRAEWSGVVVGYQPGEYQPNALDDLAGNNFQILANAIVYAAGQAPAPVPSLSTGSRLGIASLLALAAGLVLADRALRRGAPRSRTKGRTPSGLDAGAASIR